LGAVKRIIFTVTNDLNYDQRMQRICTSLQEAGYEVTLVGRKRKKSAPILPQIFKQKRLNCFFQKGKFFYLEYNFRLFWFLLFQKTDCFSAIDLDTVLPCLFAAKLRGKKLIYDAHEYFTEVPEVVNRPFVKKIWQRIEKFSIRRVDKAYTVSASIAQLFKEKYKVEFAVIRNVPVKSTQQYEPSLVNYILYQGALNVGRGIESYIKAMHEIDSMLFLAGEGDLSADLRELVKQEKLEHKIKFLGFVPPKDLKKITAQAKIGLNCAENLGLSYYYSLNNKMFDYIMAGVPQIISNFPEFKRVNDEFNVAILAIDLQPKSIAYAVNSLLSNDQFYSQLKENCFKAREVLNWENEHRKLLALYASLGG